MKRRSYIIVSVLLLLLLVPRVTFALEPILPDCGKYTNGTISDPCTVSDLLQLLVNISQWILGVMGSVALGLFVYGGFMWVTAAGNSSRVESGKNILVGTVVGIVIVLAAYTGVKFLAKTLEAPGTNQFLGGTCQSEGDACLRDGQNVYACASDGSCSAKTLCEYWAAKPGDRYNLTASHACRNVTTCKTGTIVYNLCNGGSDTVCCQQN